MLWVYSYILFLKERSGTSYFETLKGHHIWHSRRNLYTDAVFWFMEKIPIVHKAKLSSFVPILKLNHTKLWLTNS